MSSWRTQGIDLTLTASSPMDPHRRSSALLGLSSERWSYEDNYLSMDGEVSLPQLPFIEALKIPNARRSLHPSAIGEIISSLPSLERLVLELNAPKAKRAEMQNEHRLSLANALDSPSLSNLRTLNIYIEQSIPGNHNFKNQPDDPDYPDGDVLNVVIRKLAENIHLTNLNLTGYWLVSPALFNGEGTFPYLQKVQIQGALITHDGRWYYTGNPTDVEPDYGYSRDDTDDDDEDSNSNSSFDSESQDYLHEYREALLNGEEPCHMWRTQPDPQMFDPLMKTMATAILRIPRLQKFFFSIGMSYTDDHAIIFECLKPGEHPEWFRSPQKTVELGTRCYVTLMPEARWDVPGDVAILWKEFVGDKGVVVVVAPFGKFNVI